MTFPEDKHFAVSILDDTDDSTVENVKPIYNLLWELGFRTTKTVWPLDCPEGSRLYFAGETLQNRSYLEFVHDLVAKGFELAWHGATMESSDRDRTIHALEFFHREFGFLPKIHCNHGQNRENIYWGSNRYQNLLLRGLAKLYYKGKGLPNFSGESEASPYFWGDVFRRHFRFVRNFTFPEVNILKRNRHMPYRLKETPYVAYWFSTSNAPDVKAFTQLVTRQSLDRLYREGGVCIVSTHLGKGFVKKGRPDKQVEDTLRYLATLPGWYAPVSDILEHLLATRPEGKIPFWSRLSLEFRHAASSFLQTVTDKQCI